MEDSNVDRIKTKSNYQVNDDNKAPEEKVKKKMTVKFKENQVFVIESKYMIFYNLRKKIVI
jgi:hypothetical protein